TGTGAPLSAHAFRFLTCELGVTELVGVYGMSETSNAIVRCFCDEDYETRSTTNGRPVPGASIRIVNPDTGATVPRGDVGEIHVFGYMLMKGYYKLPEETAKVFDEDGWLCTGDLGELR